MIRGGCRDDDGGGGGSSSRLSRTRRFINVVTSCRRYCRGVSVTTEADVAFLIKRSRRQGSLHCVRIVGGDVGKGLVLTTRPASLYNPAVDQFQSTTTTAIWRERERENRRPHASSRGKRSNFRCLDRAPSPCFPPRRPLSRTVDGMIDFSYSRASFFFFQRLEYAGRGNSWDEFRGKRCARRALSKSDTIWFHPIRIVLFRFFHTIFLDLLRDVVDRCSRET